MNGKVTGNVQILLGYLTHAITKQDVDWPYHVDGVDPQGGTIEVGNGHTGSTFRVSVVQTGGEE